MLLSHDQIIPTLKVLWELQHNLHLLILLPFLLQTVIVSGITERGLTSWGYGGEDKSSPLAYELWVIFTLNACTMGHGLTDFGGAATLGIGWRISAAFVLDSIVILGGSVVWAVWLCVVCGVRSGCGGVLFWGAVCRCC